MGFEDFPFVIGWELTLDCNLRCRHCASSAGLRRQAELTRAESLEICNQFVSLLVQEVIFTGGEPLLNPHWESIAARLGELEIATGIVTNGLMVDEEMTRRMKECGIKAVAVSLDGPERIHDQIRGVRGAFQKTVQGIECLAKASIDLTVITSITGTNIRTLDGMYNLVCGLGAWKWQIQPLFPIGRGEGRTELHLTETDYLAMGAYLHDLRPKAAAHGLQVVPADSCGFFSPFDFEELGWRGCTAGRTSCGVMSDGHVKGCLSWPDTTIEGDLRQDDFWTIWFRQHAFAKLRAYDKEDISGTCRDCDKAIDCGGGCQAMSLATTGTWHADPYCYRRLLTDNPGPILPQVNLAGLQAGPAGGGGN